MSDYNVEIDLYDILKLPRTATRAEILKRYQKLSLKFHPDKVLSNYKEKVKNEKGWNASQNVKMEEAYGPEDEVRWKDINNAQSFLTDNNKRIIYDNLVKRSTEGKETFDCPNCPRKDVDRAGGFPRSKSSLRYFCSADCAGTWNQSHGYTPNIFAYDENGNLKGGGNTPPKPKGPVKKCAGCEQEKPLGHWWVRYSEKASEGHCHSEYCLFEYLKKAGRNPVRCQRCGIVQKEQNETKWVRSKQKFPGLAFCSQNHLDKAWESFQKSGLDPQPDKDHSNPFQAEIDQALIDIQDALNQEPKVEISELDLVNRNYASRLQNGKWNEASQIKNLVDQVRADIAKKRAAKGGGDPNLDREKRRLVSDIQGLDGWDKLSAAVQDDFIQRIARVSKKAELKKIWEAVQDAVRNYFNNLRQSFIDKIKALDKLTEAEKKGFIDLINNNSDDNFDNILNQAKAANQAKGSGNTLQVLKNTTIAAIDGELLKDPAVETAELESSNQNWGEEIQNATKEDQIIAIKNRVFADIERKRAAKKIVNLRQEAIQKIRSELALEPAVATNELDKQDWEKVINSSSDPQIIANLLAQVLADIRSKRESKLEKDKINQLLAEAKQNWDNYQKLENILQQIKKLRSSDVYSQKESEIKKIENRLKDLDPSKYKNTNKNLLDQQLKDNGLTEDDLDEKTKKAIEEAEKDPTPEKRDKAEEGIAVCGAKKTLTNILQKVKKVVDKKDKEDLINEILMFCKKNKYTRKVSEKFKDEIAAALAKLRGEDDNEENNAPDKGGNLVLTLCLLGALLGVVVAIFLIWRRKRRLRRRIK